jgi:hypothetical protein
MMVEEIVDRRSTREPVLGRCIHWDTEAPVGASPSQARVKHLDLAINVYRGEAADRRLTQSLGADARVVDATFRTHLLRIEDIPPQALLGFASQFFVSSLLTLEWFEDQFQLAEP